MTMLTSSQKGRSTHPRNSTQDVGHERSIVFISRNEVPIQLMPVPGCDDNWFLGVMQGLLVVALGIPIGFGLKRVAAELFVEWDRSALVRLDFGSDCEARLFSDVPIVVGDALLGNYDKPLAPTIDPQKVLGFVIWKPPKSRMSRTNGVGTLVTGILRLCCDQMGTFQ